MTPQQTTILAGILLASSTVGCGAVLKAAAANPAVLAFLPIAAAAEAIAAAAKEDRKPSNGMINVTPTAAAANPLAFRNWQDPDDWLAECDGPMLCSEHEQFSCTGSPDDCYCECVSADRAAPPRRTDPNGTLVRTQ